MWNITRQFELDVIDVVLPTLVVIEYPEVWSASAKSMASATSGDLLKLASLIGCLGLTARREADVLFITPARWKGQLSKEAVERRIKQVAKLDRLYYRNHVCDAVGMGYAAQGLFDEH